MPSPQSRLRSVFQRALCTCAFTATIASAQLHPVPPDQNEITANLSTLTTGGFGPATPQQIEAARAGQLIPVLEDLFAHTADPDKKAMLASTLVRLGSTDTIFWSYLVDYARPALESDAPSPTREGPSDQLVDGHTPAYNTWAAAHHVTDMSPEGFALVNLWTRVQWLAAARDPRALPLLRQALHSPNSQIVSAAAEGLANVNDRASIPDLIAATKRSPPYLARGLALAYLSRFEDDPPAMAVVAIYRDPPKDPLTELRKNDESSTAFLEQVAKAHDTRAIPILERNFASTDTPHPSDPSGSFMFAIDKVHTASVLVRLGDKNPAFWDFLLRQATTVAESDAPPLFTYDAQGKPIQSDEPPPAFSAWAAAQDLSPEEAGQKLMFGDPAIVTFLAMTGDPRALPVLRRALSSHSFLVQNFAAEGLAKQQDTDSVPLLIDLCRRGPPEIANLIASNALLRFKDPRAQQAAEAFISPDDLKRLRADPHSAPGSDPFQ